MIAILWQKCLAPSNADEETRLPRNPNHASNATNQDWETPTGRFVLKQLEAGGPRDATATQIESQVSGIPCVIYECRPDLVLKMISPTVFELIGIRPENLLGKSALWQERLLSSDQARLVSKLNLLAGSDVASETHRIINDRGLPVWVAHSFRKVREDNHTAIRGCIVPLVTVDRLSVLDSGVADQFVHRIGNHFQLINLLIDSLKRKVSDLDEFEDLQRTIERAVDFTRSFTRYNQPPVLSASVKLGELLSSLVQSWAPHFHENDVAIEGAFHRSLDDASITGDPFLLDFAMGSILQNALDATPNGGRVIIDGRIEVLRTGGSSVARMVITDTGKGMDKDEVAKAVIPFNTTKREHDGLGLSSALRIIEMHGGVVNITSEPGRGTEVKIVLPVDRAARCSE
jgi:signal transduction histidine kinase